MLYDIVEVKYIRGYVLHIRFENGTQGEVDISKTVPFQGIFSKLQDKDYFKTVFVDEELGTIVWDNGADLSPDSLYTILSADAA